MALPLLVLVGAIGGVATYLYKNREARERVVQLSKSAVDPVVDKMPARVQQMANRLHRRSDGTQERLNQIGLIDQDQFSESEAPTTRPPGTDPL